jgi:prepilin-type processing-associated H-X9-DG protein
MRTAVQALIVALVLLMAGTVLVNLIASVREQATRMRCMNNLKQIAIAIHAYQDAQQHCPLATKPNARLAPEQRLSWLLSILPYLEANNLYARTDRDKGWEAEENRFLALTVIRTYQCPGFPDQPPTSTLVPSHYVGLAGLGPDAATLPLANQRAGFFGYERKLTPADVKGETSTLLVAMETTHVRNAWTSGGPATARGLDPDDLPCLGRTRPFGGIHRGVTNALFADGSVRFLADSIDPSVLEAAVMISGSATLKPSDLD